MIDQGASLSCNSSDPGTPPADDMQYRRAQHLLEEARQLSATFQREAARIPAAECGAIFTALGCREEYAESLYILARIEYYACDYQQALTTILRSAEMFADTGNTEFAAKARRFAGVIYSQTADYSNALAQLAIASELAARSGSKLVLGAIHNNIASVHKRQGNYKDAMSHAMAAERTLSTLPHSNPAVPTYLAESYLLIANLLIESRDYSAAMTYAERAYEVKSLLKKAEVHNVIGHCHEGLNNYESAIEQFRQSYFSARAHQQSWSMTAAIASIGSMYRRLQQHERAVRYLRLGLERMRSYGDRNTVITVVVEIAYSYLELEKYRSAHDALDEALTLATELELLPQQQLVHQAFRGHYTRTGDYKLALEHYTRFHECREKVLSAEQKTTLDRLQMEFTMELKLKEEEIRQRNNVLEAVIAAQELERERIARDLHDGVGQMLAAARMNLTLFSESASPENGSADTSANHLHRASAILDGSIEDLRAISHALGSSTLREMGLGAALDELIGNLQADGGTEFELVTSGLESRLPEPVESGLFRIAQELIANIIRHANARLATVQIICDSAETRLTVEDNGSGFDLSAARGHGMGGRNIAARVEALEGELHYDSTPGHGTTVSVIVPAGSGLVPASTGLS